MPLQNRVTPEGDIIAHAARGLMMGNRGGALHDELRSLRRRRWVTRKWICCRLDFKGRQRIVMSPGQYTELFFLDEATALAAGHRPCFECRRDDAVGFATFWARVNGRSGRATAPEMDAVLQPERVDTRGRKVVYQASFADLPDGTFVRRDQRSYLVMGTRLAPWAADGYGTPVGRPRNSVADVLTPRSIVAVLAAGYVPAMHPSAGRPD